MTVGLTGGIGSGKSLVARILEMLGCAVFDSDVAAKAIYFDDAVKPQVIGLLGKEVYAGEREINKQLISSLIFSDTLLLHRLNDILHPPVINKFRDFTARHRGKIIIKETALLFEANLTGEVDKIIVVTAPDALRIERTMARDGSSPDEVRKKIKTQLPQEEKIKKADFVIVNNEADLLITQVLTIHARLKETLAG